MDEVKNNNKISCFFGTHEYKVLKEEELLSLRGTKVGIIIISRCISCGKIRHNTIGTIDNHI